MSDAYWEYLKLMVLETKLISNRLEASSRMVGLREEMDDYWCRIPSNEKEKIRRLKDEFSRLIGV